MTIKRNVPIRKKCPGTRRGEPTATVEKKRSRSSNTTSPMRRLKLPETNFEAKIWPAFAKSEICVMQTCCWKFPTNNSKGHPKVPRCALTPLPPF